MSDRKLIWAQNPFFGKKIFRQKMDFLIDDGPILDQKKKLRLKNVPDQQIILTQKRFGKEKNAFFI